MSIGEGNLASDFNVVRKKEERMVYGGVSQQRGRKIEEFNSFIDGMELVETSIVGKRFTWVHIGGNDMSKIDRILMLGPFGRGECKKD